MHDTRCLGLVHWDDPEGWNGEGGGRRVQDGEHMYTCGDSAGCGGLGMLLKGDARPINSSQKGAGKWPSPRKLLEVRA